MEAVFDREQPSTLGQLVASLVGAALALPEPGADSALEPGTGSGDLTSSPLTGLADELDAAQCVTLLTALEQVRTMCSAVQMEATVRLLAARRTELAQTQAQLGDAPDFAAYRQAKEQARSCSVDGVFRRSDDPEPVVGASDSAVFPQPGGRGRRHRPASTGVFAQVALARRQSPHYGARFTTTAAVTVARLPFVHSLVLAGLLPEHRAWVIVSTISVLSDEQRSIIDAQLRDRYGAELSLWSDRQLRHTVGALVAQLDAAALVTQHEQACADARVSVRPAFAGMSYVTALLPAADGIAITQSLARSAAGAKADGDDRATGVIATEILRRRVLQQDEGAAPHVELVLVGTRDAFDPPTPPGRMQQRPSPRNDCVPILHWPQPSMSPLTALTSGAAGAAASADRPARAPSDAEDGPGTASTSGPVSAGSEAAVSAGSAASAAPGTAGLPNAAASAAGPGTASAESLRVTAAESATSVMTATTNTSATHTAATNTAAQPPGKLSPSSTAGIPDPDPDLDPRSVRPMFLYGHGLLPGQLVLDLIEATSRAEKAQVRVRRAVHDPRTGQLLELEQRSRPVPREHLHGLRTTAQALSAWLAELPEPVWTPHETLERTFTGPLRMLLRLRDGGWCRTPWCGAPIRHVDHIRPYADDGPTSESNGQGLCVRCNLVKEQLGWSHTRDAAQSRSQAQSESQAQSPSQAESPVAHRVTITTPTGHRYRSEAPDVLCLRTGPVGTARNQPHAPTVEAPTVEAPTVEATPTAGTPRAGATTAGATTAGAPSPLERLLGDLLTDLLGAA